MRAADGHIWSAEFLGFSPIKAAAQFPRRNSANADASYSSPFSLSGAHSLTLSSICDQLNNLRFVTQDPRHELQKLVCTMLRLQYASVHLRCQVNFSSTNPVFSPGTRSEEIVLFWGEQSSRRNKESQKKHPGTKSQTAPMTV